MGSVALFRRCVDSSARAVEVRRRADDPTCNGRVTKKCSYRAFNIHTPNAYGVSGISVYTQWEVARETENEKCGWRGNQRKANLKQSGFFRNQMSPCGITGGPTLELAKGVQTAANQASSPDFKPARNLHTFFVVDRDGRRYLAKYSIYDSRVLFCTVRLSSSGTGEEPHQITLATTTIQTLDSLVELLFRHMVNDSSNQAVCSMAELMDCFIIPPVINDSLIANPFVGYGKSEQLAMLAFHINDSLIANPFVGYGKSEQLAMLAFHVARVLQLRPNECPLSEAYTVLGLLKAHELGKPSLELRREMVTVEEELITPAYYLWVEKCERLSFNT
ncbi:hypothetical protein Tcan_16282 [Toxocara canis]|uniref:Uncharacterized protein n=1 Tax=Toxocara canis TaxID=6265 RepID=A0A0B2V2W4_TOXCA|nr:hypothetical protein Tcan_16282 [Toxocara canis]